MALREHRLDVRELFRLEADLVGVPRRLGAVLAVFGAAARLNVEQSAELDLVGRVVQAVDRGLRGIEWVQVCTEAYERAEDSSPP